MFPLTICTYHGHVYLTRARCAMRKFMSRIICAFDRIIMITSVFHVSFPQMRKFYRFVICAFHIQYGRFSDRIPYRIIHLDDTFTFGDRRITMYTCNWYTTGHLPSPFDLTSPPDVGDFPVFWKNRNVACASYRARYRSSFWKRLRSTIPRDDVERVGGFAEYSAAQQMTSLARWRLQSQGVHGRECQMMGEVGRVHHSSRE